MLPQKPNQMGTPLPMTYLNHETQRFTIFNVLCDHCGQVLTADNLDKIMAEIIHEMREGPCSWAFSPND